MTRVCQKVSEAGISVVRRPVSQETCNGMKDLNRGGSVTIMIIRVKQLTTVIDMLTDKVMDTKGDHNCT